MYMTSWGLPPPRPPGLVLRDSRLLDPPRGGSRPPTPCICEGGLGAAAPQPGAAPQNKAPPEFMYMCNTLGLYF